MKKIRHCHPMYRTVVLCSKNLYPHKTNFWLRPLTAAQSIQIIISHQSPLTRPESTQYDAGQLALCSSHISSHLEPDISVRQKSMSHGVHYRSSISNKHSSVQLRDHRPVCVCVCVRAHVTVVMVSVQCTVPSVCRHCTVHRGDCTQLYT